MTVAYIREYATLGQDELGQGAPSLVEPALNSDKFAVPPFLGTPIDTLNAETRFVSIRPVGKDIVFKTGAEGETVIAAWGIDTFLPDGEEVILAVEPGTVISLARQFSG